MFKMRNSSMIASMAAVVVAGSASASMSYLTMTQAANPSNTGWTTTTGSAFASEFNYQSNNSKLRMWNRLGSSSNPTQFVNPGNTYWGPNSFNPSAPRPSRSWEVIWNNTTGTMTTKIYDTENWTGAASANLSMTLPTTVFGGQANAGGDFTLRGVAQFASGTAQSTGGFYFRVNARVDNGTNNLTGINFLTAPASIGSIVLSNVQFNGGNGFVGVGGVDGTYSGSSANNFYNLAVVPAPGALALLGAAGLVGARRRRA
jgi:hypothetical protein